MIETKIYGYTVTEFIETLVEGGIKDSIIIGFVKELEQMINEDSELINWIHANNADLIYSDASQKWYINYYNFGKFLSGELCDSPREAIRLSISDFALYDSYKQFKTSHPIGAFNIETIMRYCPCDKEYAENILNFAINNDLVDKKDIGYFHIK